MDDSITITVDGEDPTVSNFEPEDGATLASGSTVSYDSDGTGSSVVEEKIWVYDNTNKNSEDVVASSNSKSVTIDDLEHETDYYVSYYVEDEAGNSINESENWGFTADTKYEGGEPSLPDDQYYLVDGDGDFSFDVSVTTGDEDEVTVTCYNGDDDELGSDTISGDDNEATCSIDMDDYSGETEIYAQAKDEAGNTGEQTDTRTYYFDAEEPILDIVEPEVTTFNGPFQLSYDAEDESGIEQVEYFFDEDLNKGEGNISDYEEDEPVTVDPSGLDAGDQTVYLRVQDVAGRWSAASSFEFEYRPEATPELSLEAPSNLEVTAGSEISFEARAENTGELRVKDGTVSISGTGVSGEKQLPDMEPGDTFNVSFDVAGAEENIGEHTLTLETNPAQATREINLRIKANEAQRSSIESMLEGYESSLQEIESNVTSLESKVSGSLKQRLQGNLTEFKSNVQEARQAVEAGEYYRAQETLQGIDQKEQAARNTYTEVRQTYQQNQLVMYGVAGGAVLLLLGAGGAFMFYRSEEYGLDLDRIVDSDISVTSLEGVKSRIRSIMKDEPEAEEFEWNGFQ